METTLKEMIKFKKSTVLMHYQQSLTPATASMLENVLLSLNYATAVTGSQGQNVKSVYGK